MKPYFINVMEFGPVTMARIVNRIDPHRFDERTDPDRFTLREAIAHMADWEPILRGRIRTGVETPGATIEAYDEGELADKNAYQTKNVSESLETYRRERAETVRYVQGLSDEDLQKHFIHPERGPLTISDMVYMMNGHDLYHIEHLTQYLAEKTSATW